MNQTENSAASTGIAITLLSLTFFIATVFQTYILLTSQQNMRTARANQENAFQEAGKLRQRVQGLAGRTAKLAEEGDENAKAIVDNFRRQGVELKPSPK
jgi:hypothetical protein